MKRPLFACLAALWFSLAQAGTGLTELPASATDGPVTVYYPSSAADAPLQRMVESIQSGRIAGFIPFDAQGQPVHFG
mgnify:CR=1 FL=1